MSKGSSFFCPIFTPSAGRLHLAAGLSVASRLAAFAQTLRVASADEASELMAGVVALIHGLEGAKPRYMPVMGRGRAARAPQIDEALGAVVRAWPRLGPHERLRARSDLRVLTASGLWARAVRQAAVSRDGAERAAAAEAIGDGAGLAGARPLVALLADTERAVVDAADRALRRRVDGEQGSGWKPDADDDLDRCLADAVRAFPSHRRRGVLESASLFLSPARLVASARQVSDLARWFKASDSDSHGALRAVIRRSSEPLMRARAWEWLGGSGPSVAAAALDCVAGAASPTDHEAVLRRAHLMANPARARRVGVHGGRSGAARVPALPGPGVIPTLGIEARRGLALLARTLPADDAAGGRVLGLLLEDSDPMTRFLAGAGRASVPRPDGSLGNGIDERFRLGLWLRFGGDEGVLGASLAARASEGPALERAEAIECARRLGVVRAVELEALRALAGASGGPDEERLAAIAATALGECGSESAREALVACLRHPAARVRANAVEALGRLSRRRHPGDLGASDPALYGAMLELSGDAQHRVRANALHVLLAREVAYEPGAEEAWRAMLADDRAPHRTAAFWLGERLLWRRPPGARGWNHLAACVAEAARAERDPAARVRAESCARRVLTAVRAEWRERASGSAEGAAS